MTETPPSPPGGEGHRQRPYRPPEGATTVLLIRHGESEAARPERPFDLVGGHGDPPLHPEGRVQAERLADRLAVEPIDACYVTTLRRTAETAAPLLARTGLVARVEPDLREVHLGEWEGGAYRRHMAEGHPLARAALADERWDRIPGAETNGALDARVAAGLARIVAACPGQLVAVFAHGGVIASALATATGSRPFAFLGADNASISVLVSVGERWVLRGFNDVGHLGRGYGRPPGAAGPAT